MIYMVLTQDFLNKKSSRTVFFGWFRESPGGDLGKTHLLYENSVKRLQTDP